MQLGHVIYKVKDLFRAVADFEIRGLVVKYDTVKRPYNALIYFSFGFYLELLAHTGMLPFLGCPLALSPCRGVARRSLS